MALSHAVEWIDLKEAVAVSELPGTSAAGRGVTICTFVAT
jgi:hypothetical protein